MVKFEIVTKENMKSDTLSNGKEWLQEHFQVKLLKFL